MKRREKGWWVRCLYKMLSWEPYFFPVLRSEGCCSLHRRARNDCVEYNVGSFSKDRTGFAAVTNKPSNLSVLIQLRFTSYSGWSLVLSSSILQKCCLEHKAFKEGELEGGSVWLLTTLVRKGHMAVPFPSLAVWLQSSCRRVWQTSEYMGIWWEVPTPRNFSSRRSWSVFTNSLRPHGL